MCTAFLVGASLLFTGCYRLQGSEGGGQVRFDGTRTVDARDVAVPDGYLVEAIATGLTYPTGVAIDPDGNLYVTEAGYAYGAEPGTARLLALEQDGSFRILAEGDNPPWNGLDYHDGALFVAGGHVHGGEILRIGVDGEVRPVLTGLPSYGDHHTNGPVVGEDGFIYFAQGTATNAGVVGVDNYAYGWLDDHPDFHDVPCEDVVLTGRNFTTTNPLTADRRDRMTTGAYRPFGTPSEEGEVVRGTVPCNGAIFRVPIRGGELELIAWGLRNPYALAFRPGGDLYTTENAYDDRGSRPIWGTADYLWRVEPGTWYGWPDYAGGVPISVFKPPGEQRPAPLLSGMPEPPEPLARLAVHSSSNGFDFSRSSRFGFVGEAFVAQFGDMAPTVGKVIDPVGFRVVRVDVETGVVHVFAENRRRHGPASYGGGGGFERPIAARFSPDGETLYVVDFGVMTMGDDPRPYQETGVLWKITKVTP